MSEIITSTEQEILIAHMVDRLPALRKKYGISQTGIYIIIPLTFPIL